MPPAERSPGNPLALGQTMWLEADRARAPLGDFPPRWADAFGDDEFGLWADFVLQGVRQRMRWIEPGGFVMGSSDEERQRIDDKGIREEADRRESPAHPVKISRGFWLADTPCTQALWAAVLGGRNPSRFAEGADAPQRPVERVSWDYAQRFLQALALALPHSQPALPSETEWEYACRAGTQAAYWWGDQMHPDLANVAPQLDGTSPVKRYRPNPWGLHDMHGNVWEWCADTDLRAYQGRPEADPQGIAGGDVRVLRGGAWTFPADLARSASRAPGRRGHLWYAPGFRFALRSPGPGGPAAL